jgi:hypothetical protein
MEECCDLLAWAALRLIREVVEELALPGCVPNDEYLSP